MADKIVDEVRDDLERLSDAAFERKYAAWGLPGKPFTKADARRPVVLPPEAQ